MSERFETLAARIDERFGEQMLRLPSICGELSYTLDKDDLIEIATALRNEADFGFEMLMDVCGDEADEFDPRRFAVVYHLLSLQHNIRLRLRVYTGTANPPVVKSVVDIWNGANWFEREVFDLYGILFEGHPDLRRILTDYGFIGHPFRKDFPLSGNVEVHYDDNEGRVVYRPVSIEPRTLVPRVIRDDNRYAADLKDADDG
jgi:NADH-quinone oxidoreductase subunit C